jgi:hypothetical protein
MKSEIQQIPKKGRMQTRFTLTFKADENIAVNPTNFAEVARAMSKTIMGYADQQTENIR